MCFDAGDERNARGAPDMFGFELHAAVRQASLVPHAVTSFVVIDGSSGPCDGAKAPTALWVVCLIDGYASVWWRKGFCLDESGLKRRVNKHVIGLPISVGGTIESYGHGGQ